MTLLPYEDFYITSPLSPDDVEALLAAYVSPAFNDSFKDKLTNRYSAYYRGFVNSSGFKIVPVVVGRNSFVPQIVGNIEQMELGSRIRLTIKLYTPSLIIAWILFAFLGISAVVILIKGARANQFDQDFFTPFGVMTFMYIVMMVCFVPESVSSKKFLLEVFEAEYE